MLPYSLGSAMISALTGILVSRTGKYRPIIWAGFAVMTIGYGLMTLLTDKSHIVERAIFPLIAAFGTGCLFQVPLIGLQAAMPLKDMATSTSTFGFIRQLGGTIGISIGQAIWSSVLQRKARSLTDVTIDTSPAALAQSVRQLRTMFPDPAQHQEVVHAYTSAIATIWIVLTPMLGVSFVLVLLLKSYTLKRLTVKGAATAAAKPREDVEAPPTSVDDEKKGNDLEAGISEEAVGEDEEERVKEKQQRAAINTQNDSLNSETNTSFAPETDDPKTT